MSRRFNKLLKDSGMVLSQPRTRSTSHSKDMNTLCQDISLELLSVGGTTDGEGEDEEDVEIREDNRDEQAETQPNTDVDKRAACIISQIERNSTLMTNDPLAEQLRIETLKELTQSLSVKRTVRAKLVQTVSQKNKVHPIGFFRRLKYRLSIVFTRIRMWIHDLVYGYELWYGSLKTIEGHFGSDVASYFKFLRWLFLYNCFVFIMSFIFVIIPQGIYVEKYKRNGVAHVDNILTSVSDVMSSSINTPSKNLSQFSLSDFITGEGFFTNSTMYYGFYTDQSLKIGSFIYSIPTAYFFTAFFSYLFVFITLSIRMARSYRKSFIETSGGVKNVYALKIICAWDFSIADENAAKLKSETLARELKEMLTDDLKSSYQKSKSMRRVYIVVVRCVVNVLFFVMLGGTGVLVYTLLNRLLLNKLNSHTSGLVTAIIPGKYAPKLSSSVNGIDGDDESERDWQVDPIFMSFVVTFLLIIMPLLFSWIVRSANIIYSFTFGFSNRQFEHLLPVAQYYLLHFNRN
ncbi:transmembrane channel-like protein 7 [Nilaparvata lugens]|uniref:transmembrane channel-like protein 7 n=1 Tax=Nilaparvata lugens TaxID=108931 RepID=UPI00193DBFC9|nr:transmembrane channel-like protein 7 [Nilaparvata lugens]